MTEPEPLLPFALNPVRPEDGPQDVPQEAGSVLPEHEALLTATAPPAALTAYLNAARSQLGTIAHTSGWTPYGQWYANRHGDPTFATGNFCDMFASWAAWKASDGSEVGEYAFCPYHAAWFAAHGHWGHTPRIGGLVFYNWYGRLGSTDNAEHVGIVEDIRSDGRIVTIEGNTTQDGAGGPAGVWRRVRNPNGVVIGYGYPPYPTSPTPVPTPAATTAGNSWFVGVS